jgi:hypothetical protein
MDDYSHAPPDTSHQEGIVPASRLNGQVEETSSQKFSDPLTDKAMFDANSPQ